jgi:acetyl/propionyl-CoA carboxylase alpha subunit
MIAKLIAHGSDRTEALSRLLRAIADYRIEGVATTLSFGKFVLEHPAFTSGQFDTHFVKKHFTKEALTVGEQQEATVAAALALRLYLAEKERLHVPQAEGTGWWKW